MRALEKLFTPIKIDSLELKNRIVLPPMATSYATTEGMVTERLIEYHRKRAEGGVGLNIVEHTAIVPSGKSSPRMTCIFDDKYIPGFQRLADVVHKEGGKIALQLNHVGRQGSSSVTGMLIVGPSAIPASEGGEAPHALTKEEIKELVEAFTDGALRAKKAGMDAVELHGAHGYLICEFFSPYSNKRKDEYGGNTENRCRFAVEILHGVREKVGKDFPILFRISADEFVEGGLRLEETKKIAQILEREGADAIHVSVCLGQTAAYASAPYYLPQGHLADYTAGIKSVVNIPVIAVGRIKDHLVAERILEEEKADLISMGRALLADPYLPKKAAAEQFDKIIPCISCNLGCGDRRQSPIRHVNCLTNPETGREIEFKLKPATVHKRVVVIGAGPAGLEAARVCALRGHRVTLFEKENKLGGTFLVASLPPLKRELKDYINYLEREIKKLGVEIKLGQEVTPTTVLELAPDVAIVATGATYRRPPMKGTERGNVVLAVDVLQEKVAVGENVLIIGGDVTGLETADFLAQRGKKVTVLEKLDSVASDMVSSVWYFLRQRLIEADVQIVTSAEAKEITSEGVLVDRKGRMEKMNGFDTIVLAFGAAPNDSLKKQLEGKVSELYLIGDALQVRTALEAVYEGSELARRI